jgi:hypothetical protein
LAIFCVAHDRKPHNTGRSVVVGIIVDDGTMARFRPHVGEVAVRDHPPRSGIERPQSLRENCPKN